MVNVSRRKSTRPRLAPWLHATVRQAIPLGSHLHLRVRIRGNTLHLLCETNCPTDKDEVSDAIIHAIRRSPKPLVLLTPDPPVSIYRLIVYGRLQQDPSSLWVGSINLLEQLNEPTPITPHDDTQLLVTYQSLARSGAPEAIARYLSDCFNHLGISIQATIQNYPATETEPETQRLWITCQCDYSPEYALLTEPLVQELRELEIQGLRDGVIRCQIRGEQRPEWLIWVDLTPPQMMLREWGRWGDEQAIAHLLNQGMVAHGIAVKVLHRQETLHVFCYPIDPLEIKDINKKIALQVVIPVLEDLAPQGFTSATIYGTISDDAAPLWVEWLPLAAQEIPKLQTSPRELARQGNLEALLFLLQRLLNPNLSERLATGGVRVKLFTKGTILHVMTEAIACPTKDQTIEILTPFFKELESEHFTGLRIYGRRSGQVKAVWQKRLELIEAPPILEENPIEFTQNLQDLPDTNPIINPDELVLSTTPFLLEEFSQTCRTIVCASKLWTPEQNSASPVLSKQYQQPSNHPLMTDKGVKVALVWGFLGILLTVQTDWLAGQWLQKNLPNQATAEEVSSLNLALNTPQPLEVPELNLQKSAFLDQKKDSFTEAGQNELTMLPEATLAKMSTAPKAIAPPEKVDHPLFNSPMLDEKLALYQKRVQENGVPDILIVGSSRALRGLDPLALQQSLIAQGYPKLDIFNFGLNGATVKVFDLLLREIIPAEQLPQLIIWADGSRAFNSGRKDITYDIITGSKGYQQLQAGTFPNLFVQQDETTTSSETEKTKKTAQEPLNLDSEANQLLAEFSVVYEQRNTFKNLVFEEVFPQLEALNPLNTAENKTVAESEKLQTLEVNGETINLDGFLSISKQFEPDYYYRNHPKVSGDYDSDYSEFNLDGEQHQAFVNLLQYFDSHQVKLVLINQPLTDKYLDDPIRQGYETSFRNYISQISTQKNLTFRDFVSQAYWQQHYKLYSDPSHLNRFGASQMARQLAQDPLIQWPLTANYDIR